MNRLLGAVLFLGLAACGSTTVDPAGGGGSSSASTSSSGSSGSAGEGGAGGGVTCGFLGPGKLSIAVTAPADAPAATCGDVKSVAFDGKVRTKDGSLFVDTCGPAADCSMPREYEIVVKGSLFSSEDAKAIPDGTFVHVAWALTDSPVGIKSCYTAVLVRNLPTWQGVANPTASHSSLWLFATNDAALEAVGVAEDRAALTVTQGALCTSVDAEPNETDWIKLTATDAKVSVQASPELRASLAIPSGAQKGDYTVINDSVGVSGIIFNSYAIVRKGP